MLLWREVEVGWRADTAQLDIACLVSAFGHAVSSDVVGEPIQAKTCNYDAANLAIAGVERHRKLYDSLLGRQTL